MKYGISRLRGKTANHLIVQDILSDRLPDGPVKISDKSMANQILQGIGIHY